MMEIMTACDNEPETTMKCIQVNGTDADDGSASHVILYRMNTKLNGIITLEAEELETIVKDYETLKAHTPRFCKFCGNQMSPYYKYQYRGEYGNAVECTIYNCTKCGCQQCIEKELESE